MRDDKSLYAAYAIQYLLIVLLIYLYDNDFNTSLDLQHLYSAASSGLGVAFIGVILFNRYLWRARIVRAIFKIKTPYVQGRWEGHIKSSYSKHQVEHPVVVEFWQTMTTIILWYYDGNAVTRGLFAAFAFEAEGGPLRLYCIYQNQPIRTDQKSLKAHTGVMELFVLPSEDKMVGIYYNNAHERPTYGDMTLRFVSRRRLGTFRSE
jgi:hypothetical protein